MLLPKESFLPWSESFVSRAVRIFTPRMDAVQARAARCLWAAGFSSPRQIAVLLGLDEADVRWHLEKVREVLIRQGEKVIPPLEDR